MPEPIKSADDGTGAPPAGGGTGEPPKPPETPKKLEMTQDEFDRIIADRVARAKPKDYDELVKLKESRDAAAEAEKTELQKAKDAAALAKADGAAAIAKANAKLIRAEILTQATAQGAIDTDTVIALLAGSEDIVIDGDEVKGVKTAVKKLLEAKPFLAGKAGAPSDKGGAEFRGTDPKTALERIKQLETEASQATDSKIRQAKLSEARDLKMAGALAAR